MAGIRGKNTRIEVTIRHALFARGLRYRLHNSALPGKPDLTFPKHRVVLFIHGCFWHGHDCRLFRQPGTNADFWLAKIGENRERDARNSAKLFADGWRVMTIWECAIRGQDADALGRVVARTVRWIVSRSKKAEIRGQ